MNDYSGGESCNLVGVLGIVSQVALGLIIMGTMLGILC